MALPKHLEKFKTHPIPILNDGHIQLIDVMGSDQDIVNAARVSYGDGTQRVSEDRHLLRYLLRNYHTSPFEMCELKVRVRVPMDAWRQWIRHRTASVNEYSTRYSEAINSSQTTKDNAWRKQARNNKQGSAGVVTDWPEKFVFPETVMLMDQATLEEHGPGKYLSFRETQLQDLAREVYDERLRFNVAREQARKDLPLCTYTEAYWKMDLHNLLHFLRLRMDSHAQLEIREFANALASIVKEWVPWTWEAFEDYRIHTMNFSKFELQALKQIIQGYAKSQGDSTLLEALKASGLDEKDDRREWKELKHKLLTLLEEN